MILNWSEFKNLVSSRDIDLIMVETTDYYKVFAQDKNIVFETIIFKANTDDCNDFESNYKENCNLELINKVTPTAPLNIHELKPYGLTHKHIDSSQYIYDITLSDKDDKTYTYSCSATPAYYDCISSTNGELRDGVYSVDSGNSELVTWFGSLANGSYKLIKPVDVDILLHSDYSSYYLWGIYFTVLDHSLDDLSRLQIIDIDNILGYGANFIVKEYDECWVDQMDRLVFVKTPDGSPGEVPAGLYLRVKYYPKDVTKTDIKLWIDYALTVKD